MTKCLYAGIDGLDVAFQGALSDRSLSLLAEAKEKAAIDMIPVTITLGTLPVRVHETGAPGGYAYRFDTGEDGEIWFVSKNPDRTRFNIRVSVRALALALNGYEAIKARLYERLEAMGATVLSESIGRIDICADLELDGFELDPEMIILPAQATQTDHCDGDVVMHRKARKVTSITIGKMPGRQVCIYDKRREATHKRLWHWFDIWGRDQDDKRPVWRVEIRCGKKALKDQWQVTTWADLEAILPDFIAATTQNIRIVDSCIGKNVSRWGTHEFWRGAAKSLMAVTDGQRSGIVPGRIVRGRRSELDNTLSSLIVGIAASLAEVRRCDDIELLSSEIGEAIASAALDRNDWSRRRSRAARRMSFIEETHEAQ